MPSAPPPGDVPDALSATLRRVSGCLALCLIGTNCGPGGSCTPAPSVPQTGTASPAVQSGPEEALSDAKHPGPCLEESFDGSGTLSSRATYHYDSAGRLLREEHDGGGGAAGAPDGHPDFVTDYVYDAAGLLLRKSLDVGGNGSVNKVASYTYDDQGRQAREEIDWLGGFPDGTVDMTTRTEYDAQGRKVRELRGGAEPGMIQVTVFGYDAAGHLVLEETDEGADDSVEGRVRHELDAQGRAVTKVEERLGATAGPSGRLMRRWTYVYDARGRRVREQLDADGDGTVDFVEKHEHDAVGNLVAKTAQDTAGEIRGHIVMGYACFESGSGAARP